VNGIQIMSSLQSLMVLLENLVKADRTEFSPLASLILAVLKGDDWGEKWHAFVLQQQKLQQDAEDTISAFVQADERVKVLEVENLQLKEQLDRSHEQLAEIRTLLEGERNKSTQLVTQKASLDELIKARLLPLQDVAQRKLVALQNRKSRSDVNLFELLDLREVVTRLAFEERVFVTHLETLKREEDRLRTKLKAEGMEQAAIDLAIVSDPPRPMVEKRLRHVQDELALVRPRLAQLEGQARLEGEKKVNLNNQVLAVNIVLDMLVQEKGGSKRKKK